MRHAETRIGRIGWALLAVTLLAGVLAGPLAQPAAAAASTPTPLLQDPADTRMPLSTGPAVTFVVDRVRSHLFAATGFPISTVMVTDMAGVLLKTITGEVGALGMTVSPDGNSLYVALREADAISEIDLVSLTERRRIPTGTASCPSWLATAGSRVWVSYGCSYNKAAIVSLDPTAPSVSLPSPPDDRYFTPPHISAASSTSKLLVAATGSSVNSTIDLYDASASALVRTQTFFSDRVYYASAVAVTPDEKTAFVVAIDGSGRLGSYGAIAFSLPDLSRGPLYRTGPHTAGIAVSPDGSHVAMTAGGLYGSDFWVFPVGVVTPTHTRNYPDLQGPGAPVAFNGDGSKAFLFRRNTDNSPSLTVVNGLGVDPARMSVRPTPSAGVAAGSTTTVTGAVRTTDGTSNRGLAIAVTRSGPDGRRALPPVATNADGVFAVADVPPGPGGYAYRFTWPGDLAHPPASASGSLRVLGSPAPSALPPPPAAATIDNDLLAKFGALVVDELHRRVFVSDQGGGVVAVTDLDGNRIGAVTGLPGALGMALSRDSTTLYVALSTANAVAAVDAADLVEVGRWRVGPLAELPGALAEAGNQIFFGYHDIEDSGGGWGSFNLSAPDDVSIWDHIEGPTQTALFATSRSNPNLLIAGNYYGETGRYDVSTTPPRELAFRFTLAAGTDPRLSDDGSSLMLAGTSPVNPVTLTPQVNPHYTSELDVQYAVAITADATFVAVGAEQDSTASRIRLWPRGGDEPLRVISVKGDVVWQGMSFTSDASRLYVITADSGSSGDHPVMHVLDRPTAPKAPTAYGWNGLGQLGMGATTDTRAVPTLPGGAISIAAGIHHSLALGRDGTVWAWGWNGYGQLGDGSTTATVGPVKVERLSDVVAIGAGLADSFAVKRDGSLWAWGWNGVGQLGDGSTTDHSLPVQVPIPTEVASVSAGVYHTLALGRDGSVWSWGWNGLGLLGDGTTTDHLRPQVVPGLVNVRSIAAGWLHSLASDSDRNVWTWGWNAYGQLGDGTTTDRRSPTRLAVAAHVEAVAAGADHSMLLTMEGQIWTWGWNGVGQLGDGTLTDRNRPVQVPGFYGGATAISAGVGQSLAVISGVAVGWGWNAYGQLGDGTWTDRRLPAGTIGLGTASSVAAGGLHSMAI